MTDDCRAIAALLDAYLSGELSAADVERVDHHLERCPDCDRDVRAGRRLKSALSAALDVEVGTIDPLRERVLTAIAGMEVPESSRLRRLRNLLPLAAGLLVGVAMTVALMRGAGEARDEAAYSDSLLSHATCAVMRQVPETPTREEAAMKLGLYRGLLDEIPLAPSGLELVDAHVCPSLHRKFGHVVLRIDGAIVSVLVTEKSRGSLPPGDGTARSGTVDVQTVGFPFFELAGFESEQFLGFVVTPRSGRDRNEIADRLVPGAFRVLGELDTR